jgi:chemotaxis methyl-accepting protein methylase
LTASVLPPPFVVGIGGGAGALAPVVEVVQALAGSSACVLVALQPGLHDAAHLALLLRHRAALPVSVLRGGEGPEPGTAYVLPADQLLRVRDGQLQLTPIVDPDPQVVDALFEAGAAGFGERFLGVLLSGMGADGTAGARSVRRAGGLVFGQDPDEAEFPGMPASAVWWSAVDQVLPTASLAHRLWTVLARAGEPAVDAAALADDVLELASARATPLGSLHPRRLGDAIRRRARVLGVESAAAYAACLQDVGSELDALAAEALRPASVLFSPDVDWERLQARVLVPALRVARPGDEVRIWVAGCGTGEEAYAIAMSAHDAAQRLRRDVRLRVFATDVDEGCLAIAERGLFPTSWTRGIAEGRVRRWLTREADGWRVRQEIRRSLVFGKHDLTADPPYGRLALVVCRGVLASLADPFRPRVLRRLIGGLAEGGHLLLGPEDSLPPTPLPLDIVGAGPNLYVRSGQAEPGARQTANGGGLHERAALEASLVSRAARCLYIADDDEVFADFGVSRRGADCTGRHYAAALPAHVVSRLDTVLPMLRSERSSWSAEGMADPRHAQPPVDVWARSFAADADRRPFTAVVVEPSAAGAADPRVASATLGRELARERAALVAALERLPKQEDAVARMRVELSHIEETRLRRLQQLSALREQLSGMASGDDETASLTEALFQILELHRVGVAVLDEHGTILEVMGSFSASLPLTASDIGRRLADVRHAYRDDLHTLIDHACTHRSQQRLRTRVPGAGSHHLVVVPSVAASGEVEGCVVVLAKDNDPDGVLLERRSRRWL